MHTKGVLCFCLWKHMDRVLAITMTKMDIIGKPYLQLPIATKYLAMPSPPKLHCYPLICHQAFGAGESLKENHWSGHPGALSIVEDPSALFIHRIQTANHTTEPVLSLLRSTQEPNSDARNLHWLVKPTDFFIVKSIIHMVITHTIQLLFIHPHTVFICSIFMMFYALFPFHVMHN